MIAGGLAFAQPWVLAAFIVLPLIWWLLRLIPPAPRLVRFPPVRLLLDLAGREETPVRAPPWLIALRLLLAALVILGLAGPIFNPGALLDGDGPLVLVVDDGWTAASRWSSRVAAMERYIDRAERGGRAVILLTTAPAAGAAANDGDARAPEPMAPARARTVVRSMAPKPWPPDRAAAAKTLAAMSIGIRGHAVWVSDGIDGGDADALAARLVNFDGFEIVTERAENLARALLPLRERDGDIAVRAVRAPSDQPGLLWMRASAGDGRLLTRAELLFAPGEEVATVALGLPLALRNQVARIEIEDQRSAGAVILADDRWRRHPVGLVSGEAIEAAQPLLSELYYLQKALAPSAEVRDGTIGELVGAGISVLVLADVGQLLEGDQARLEEWVASGGLLVRFSGPKLAEHADAALLPVALRAGGRAMGGALSWDQPARLAPFTGQSPFFGLDVPTDVLVSRQVLAEPSPGLGRLTWARLEDGTPLVTGASRGDGWIILFHVTANTDWSNLVLSGLFVEMLERVLTLAQRREPAATNAISLEPLVLMDGFGAMVKPDPGVGPLRIGPLGGGDGGAPPVSRDHPPGYYGPEIAPLALNLAATPGPIDDAFRIAPIEAPRGVTESLYGGGSETPIGPWLLALALALAIADFLLALAFRGLLPSFTGRPARAGLLAFWVIFGGAGESGAQGSADEDALRGSLEVRLAYVVTGNGRVDSISRNGLVRLGEVLSQRTTVSPAAPVAINLATDEVIFFPLIYWPLVGNERPLARQAFANLDNYLRTGGILFVDTRGIGPAVEALRRVLGRLDIPPLVRLTNDHVLNKSFYLLSRFSGFRSAGNIWVERHSGGVNDGVSSLIIADGDWAAAWALGQFARGRPQQREAAFRFGVNLVMYALTGNYKADQVHVPTLLERLGR